MTEADYSKDVLRLLKAAGKRGFTLPRICTEVRRVTGRRKVSDLRVIRNLHELREAGLVEVVARPDYDVWRIVARKDIKEKEKSE